MEESWNFLRATLVIPSVVKTNVASACVRMADGDTGEIVTGSLTLSPGEVDGFAHVHLLLLVVVA